MLRKILYLAVGAVLLSGCFVSVHKEDFLTVGEDSRILRHVVMFKFKDGTTSKQIKEFEDAFRTLPDKIDAIHSFEWGTDVSVEGKADGFTHCFVVTFAGEADRDAYLPHPAHQEFVSLVTPHKERSLVLDYWVR